MDAQLPQVVIKIMSQFLQEIAGRRIALLGRADILIDFRLENGETRDEQSQGVIIA